LALAYLCIDVHGVIQTVKIRKLNDMLTGIDTSQLYAFTKGDTPAAAVNWDKLILYFRTILKYFPAQEDTEMFLGFCEYYGLNDKQSAFMHIKHSADTVPYFFWNVYDTGVLLFKMGDMDHAVLYLELAMLVPADKMLQVMGNSIIYRQFFTQTLNADLESRLNRARERTVLLLAAAYYAKRNYDMAELFAMKGVTQKGIGDRGPFLFYEKAIQAAKATGQGIRLQQFPYPRYLRLEFY
jgi:hypothetical protein